MDGNRNIVETLYERDFAAWAVEQARAMRASAYDSIDWANVIEESRLSEYRATIPEACPYAEADVLG